MSWQDFNYHHSNTELPEHFFARVNPNAVSEPYWVHLNPKAAELLDWELGIDADESVLALLSGNALGDQHQPLAMRYAGHPFGNWVPQLGDGRAIQLAGVINQQDERWSLQLKGAGLTPFSRDGDGRAVLRSTIREYLCCEAMYGLGIPTTRALSITASDMEVYREQIENAAILMRLAPSFVRFGHFEVFASRGQIDDVKQLADHVIKYHFADLVDRQNPNEAFFHEVVLRTAELMAHWQALGFMHGVMNTDNMSRLGLTIDYGPFGFIEAYQPTHICNHSDYQGRYAYNKQPEMGLWNLVHLAEALSSLIEDDSLREILGRYEQHFVVYYTQLMRKKLGLFDDPQTEDADLINQLLDMMQQSDVDYTNTFRQLCYLHTKDNTAHGLRDHFLDREAFDRWLLSYRQRSLKSGIHPQQIEAQMKRVNPKYILRNYLAQIAIDKATKKDYSGLDTLLEILLNPYDEHPGYEHYTNPPPDWAQDLEVSCSS